MELLLLIIPLTVALLCTIFKERKILEVLNLLGATLCLIIVFFISRQVFANEYVNREWGLFYIDPLSAFVILIIGLVGFATAIYNIGYIRRDILNGVIKEERIKWYYFWYYIFIFSMFLVVTTRNMGVMWVAIEATTLASALLVAFYNNKHSLEAAWKYIIICTVGIIFALFGTFILYYAAVPITGEGSQTLNWINLMGAAGKIDPKLLKLGFIFILVGYGTKAGLAPMHTWLPDAHSQAPSPVSAVLSGVLLNCALYAIIRSHLIISKGIGIEYSSNLLIIFGLISMAVALPFVFVQYDFKRLLAYSSVEHIGIIAVAIGLGGRMAVYGAMLHMFNHAINKSLLFFVAGNITQRYRTKKIARIIGVLKAMPITGIALLFGAFAITGLPPFSIFISEFTILSSGFSQGRYIVSVIFLILVTLIFAGIMYFVVKMAFGEPPAKLALGGENFLTGALLLVMLTVLILFGVWIPPFFDQMLNQVVGVVGGGGI
ncbi:MAG: hydrogenase 4 subunit F [Peptococcaceae bacterium]|nr:hydrogenase 4 subunit F [Peptococcaceae bacterium]